MPLLLALAIALSVYVICLPGTGDGLRYYLVPSKSALCDASGSFSFAQLGKTFLDFFDFITNSVLMPIFAVATCVFIGWVLKTKAIEDEVEAEGNRFVAKRLYRFMVRYFAPILMTAILVSEVCRAFNIGGWSI